MECYWHSKWRACLDNCNVLQIFIPYAVKKNAHELWHDWRFLPTSPPTKFKLNLKHMIVYDSKDDGLMVGYEVILLSSSPTMRRRPAWIINYVNDKSSEERSVNRWLFHANCWRRHLRDVLHLWACPLSHHFISHLNTGRNYFVEILFVRLIWLLLSSRSFFFFAVAAHFSFDKLRRVWQQNLEYA